LLDAERLNPPVVDRSLAQVFSTLESESTDPEWMNQWRRAEARCKAALHGAQAGPLWAGSVVASIWSALGPEDDLHVASSMAIRDLGSFSSLKGDGPRVSANRGTNGIDGTIACAVGQARASGRPCTVLLGDLAFLHDQAALSLIGDLPLRVVVVDNGGGGIFEYLPIAQHTQVFETHFLTPHSADIPAISRAHGLHTEEITSVDGLQQALAQTGPSVLHLAVDRAGDFARHKAYWDAVCAAMEEG